MHGPGGTVVVGVSGSVGSLHALRAGLDEARLRGAPLHAVLAWTPPGGEVANRGAPSPPPLVQVWQDAARERLTVAFDEALGGLPADVPVRTSVARGRPDHVLVDVAGPGDLLVVGAGDHGPVHRLVSGSVARTCIDVAACPVLVVPPPPLLRACRAGPLARLTDRCRDLLRRW